MNPHRNVIETEDVERLALVILNALDGLPVIQAKAVLREARDLLVFGSTFDARHLDFIRQTGSDGSPPSVSPE